MFLAGLLGCPSQTDHFPLDPLFYPQCPFAGRSLRLSEQLQPFPCLRTAPISFIGWLQMPAVGKRPAVSAQPLPALCSCCVYTLWAERWDFGDAERCSRTDTATEYNNTKPSERLIGSLPSCQEAKKKKKKFKGFIVNLSAWINNSKIAEFPLIRKTWLLLSGAVEQAASVALLLYCFFPETSSVLSPLQVTPVSRERVRQALQKFPFSPVRGGGELWSSQPCSDFLPFPSLCASLQVSTSGLQHPRENTYYL